MTLTNFAEQFSARVLRKVFQRAVAPIITNSNYEGEIKKPGDRVNILSFPNGILMSDYTVGTDMNSETIVDMEDQLVVEKKRYYNFSLDSVEKIFTYGQDIPDVLLEKASETLEREIDQYVLGKFITAKAGSWIGVNLKVDGSGQTMASIVTTATGGTVTIHGNYDDPTNFGAVENPVDATIMWGGFEGSDVGKGFRLRSTATYVTPWYRIASVTSSVVATLTEWDGAVSGSDFEEGMTLRGLFGGDGVNFAKNAGGADLADMTTMAALGWEIQAAAATTVSSSSIYEAMTELHQCFLDNEIPTESLKVTVPPSFVTMLKQAAELQPTGIAEIYTGTVMNGRVGRLAGFEVLSAAGARISTRAGHSTASGQGGDVVKTTGATGYNILANHNDFMTYADKWSESRVVDAENQFAKKYQGLYLYGALVPAVRRRNGAILFAGL